MTNFPWYAKTESQKPRERETNSQEIDQRGKNKVLFVGTWGGNWNQKGKKKEDKKFSRHARIGSRRVGSEGKRYKNQKDQNQESGKRVRFSFDDKKKSAFRGKTPAKGVKSGVVR